MASPILELIEQQNAIDEKAWITFTDDYERRNPLPNETGIGWRYQMIRIGAGASLVVSGSLTIPAFQTVSSSSGMNILLSWFVGFMAFLMIDVLLFVASHQFVDMVYRPQALAGNMEQSMIMIYVGLMGVFGFVVGVSSNLYYVMIGFEVFEVGSQVADGFTIGLGILMAFAPPIQSATAGAIIALVPLASIIEKESYETSKSRAWGKYQKKRGLNLDIEAVIDKYTQSRLGMVTNNQQNTVSDSPRQSNGAKTINKKGAIAYIETHETELETIARTVLDDNPNATQKEIAESLALEITGDTRGYKTVIRAYSSLGKKMV